ncbi:MAG TPA: hypothetical protein PK467_10510, partial [Candidatus Wallbacteria bacterium]|nr:hypothetical protein [Candidatus Wallbacteria bacterium]
MMIKPNKFKDIEEFIFEVEHGYEFALDYNGHRYGILPISLKPGQFSIYEWDKAETTEKVYANAQEMLENYEIQG